MVSYVVVGLKLALRSDVAGMKLVVLFVMAGFQLVLILVVAGTEASLTFEVDNAGSELGLSSLVIGTAIEA